jgi:dextranase
VKLVGCDKHVTALAVGAALLVLLAALALVIDRSSPDDGPGPAAARPGEVGVTVTTDASRYVPGSPVRVTVEVAGASGTAPDEYDVSVTMSHLGDVVGTVGPTPVSAAAGASGEATLGWTPPREDFRGYLLRATVTDGQGNVVGTGSSAVDVSSDPGRFPRYGFVSRYDGDVQPRAVADELRAHHITDVQFYDWHRTHHVPLAGTTADPAGSWVDLAGRATEGRVVRELIDEVHGFGGEALDYNLIYGADEGYGEDGSGVDPTWGLYLNEDCAEQDHHPLPSAWPVSRIYLMDPAHTDWQNHLAARENDAFAVFPFDGFQADQLGARPVVHTCGGEEVDLASRFGAWIDAFARHTGKRIVFNAVGQYGQDQVAANPHLAYLYTEAWPATGQRTYADLKAVIEHNREVSGGKPTVLAAYLNAARGETPGEFNTAGVLMADAVIFASGGAHNELGDVGHMLSSPYYPHFNLSMTGELRRALGDYYSFLVAYQNLLRDRDVEPAAADVVMPGVETSNDGTGGTVWTFARQKGDTEILHFINLLGTTDTSWVDTDGRRPPPPVQTGRTVRHYFHGDPPRTVSLASPDLGGGQARQLEFTRGSDERGAYIEFTLPSLAYWDMVWINS